MEFTSQSKIYFVISIALASFIFYFIFFGTQLCSWNYLTSFEFWVSSIAYWAKFKKVKSAEF